MASEAVHCAEPEQDSHPNGEGDPVVLRLRRVLAIDEHLELHTKDPGWSLSSEGYPVHFGVAVRPDRRNQPWKHESWEQGSLGRQQSTTY